MDVFLILQDHLNDDWRQTTRQTLEDYTNSECVKKFRLQKTIIEDLVEKLKNDLQSATKRNNPIPPETKILASLRLLASGSFQAVIGKFITSFTNVIELYNI